MRLAIDISLLSGEVMPPMSALGVARQEIP
jgi:hypothetical protein